MKWGAHGLVIANHRVIKITDQHQPLSSCRIDLTFIKDVRAARSDLVIGSIWHFVPARSRPVFYNKLQGNTVGRLLSLDINIHLPQIIPDL